MIAFKIIVNGKQVVIAGQDDWSVLAMHVSATRDKGESSSTDYVRYSVGGLSQQNSEGISQHFRWPEIDLAVGDRVEVEVIETTEIDQPKKRYRSDHQVQEDPFTEEEAREMRYQDYLELKKEFENDIT
jgi:hypothetical protein